MVFQNEYGQSLGKRVEGWVKRPLPEKVTLKGNYCIVYPLSVDHAEDLYHDWMGIDDERDWTYLSDSKPGSKDLCYQYLRRLCSDKDRLYFSVKDASDRSVKGLFCVNKVEPDNGIFALSEINWSPVMKRTRLSTESLFLVITYFMDTLQYRRCEWRTNCLNTPAINAAERIGFRSEGILRDRKMTKGYSEDIAVFSITVHDWPEISAVLKAWLRKENFDERGRQIQKVADFRS